MQVKDSIIQQLDTAQGDVQATVNGRPGGEGYVLNTPRAILNWSNVPDPLEPNRAINR